MTESKKPPSVLEETDQISEVTDVIGGSGKWQLFVFSIVFCSKFFGAYHNFVGTFTAPKINHWCAQPEDGPWSNLTHGDWKNVTGKCIRPKNDAFDDRWPEIQNLTTQTCGRWEYDHSIFSSTITERWDLVCEKSWMSSMLRTVYMSGFLTACLVLGTLADRWGRRPILIFSGLVFVIAATGNAFAPTYAIFALTRFLVAFGRTGVMNASYILTMEVYGNQQRPIAGTMGKMGFVLGYMSLPGIAYLLRDWFELQLTITGPIFLLFLLLLVAPESPRWLITNGKLDEAAKVLAKAASWNGRPLKDPEATVKLLASKIANNKSKNGKGIALVEIMKKPKMRKNALILFFQWFVVSFVFYGLSFNAGDIGGNLFINFAIFGACQIPANLGAIFTLKYWGRRATLSGGMILAGIASLAVIPIATRTDLLWLRITLATVAMSFISACFNGSYIYSSELFPTEVRSVGLTSASVFARFGSMLSPFMKELGANNHFMAPMGVFGALSIATGLSVLLLPETKGQALMETLEQGELHGKGSESQSKNNGSTKDDKMASGDAGLTLTEFPKPT